MMRRVALGVCAWVLGCQPARPLQPLGAYCYDRAECESGSCIDYSCVQACTGDGDCADIAGYYCNAGACAAPCSVERATYDGMNVCVGGREVACGTLDDTYCDVCEDKCPGQRCVDGVGCAPLAALGEACDDDDDCNTGNCSTWAGVCRVPLGGACDATNCDLCMGGSPGWTYCSRECTSEYGRPCGNNRCLGSRESDTFYCRPDCGSDCPGVCDYSTDGSIRYCSGGSLGTLMAPPRPLLSPCQNSGQCESMLCLGTRDCAESSGCTGYRGVCSVGCTSDAQCGADGRCAALPCPAGATTNCGNVCLPTCASQSDCAPASASTCRSVALAVGGEAMLCDPRNDLNASCSNATHCVSLTCNSSNRCVSAGGSANGTACGADTDCASTNCQGSVCRGTALRGGACTTDYDCSVGTCTSGICD